VHARMQFPDLSGNAALHGRREVARDDLDGCCRALAEVTTEVAAPIFECRRLAPAHGSGGVDHPDQHIAANRLGQPGPLVLTPRWQRDMMKLDCSDRGIRHARYRGIVESGTVSTGKLIGKLVQSTWGIASAQRRSAVCRCWGGPILCRRAD